MATYQNNKVFRIVGSSKARSIPHCETNQCSGFPTQTFRFYENPSYVSCFFVGTLPHISILGRIYDPPPPIKVDGEHEYEMEDIWIQIFIIINFNILFIGMGDATPSSLMDSTTNPKVKIVEGRVGARSLTRSISGVEGCVGAPRWD
jgi:hypothetical protein